MYMYDDQYDPQILEGVKEVLKKFATQKSCGGSGISYASNPNLKKDRIQTEMINMVVDTSRLLSAVSSVNQKCSGKLTRIDTNDVVSVGACTQCEVGMDMEDSYIPFDLVKYKSQLDIDNDFLECNDLGDERQVKEMILAMMLTQMRNDMELAFIYGDEALATGAGQPKLNNLLGVNDGILKKACECTPECQIIDAQGKGLSPELFMDARRKLPPRYRRNRNNYQFLVGPGVSDWYTYYLSNRPTDAGDSALRNGEMARIFGNQMFEVPTWREDFAYGAPGSEQEVTHMLFTEMSNPILIKGREFKRKEKELDECDKVRFIGYWKQDAIWRYPERVVLIKNIDVCNFADPYVGCGVGCQDGDDSRKPSNPVQC